MEKYESAEALLKLGANPNIATKTDGQTPLLVASNFSWVDYKVSKDPKYVKLLIKYGADPNICYFENPRDLRSGYSPLMMSMGCGIEKTKALVEAGADINYKTESGRTVAIKALGSGVNASLEGLEYSHYLIVENKAKVNEAYYDSKIFTDYDPNIKYYPVTILRNWTFKLDSVDYKIKMEIVEEFARQGVNYWETEINKFTLELIKKAYPDTWEEYIKKY
jgi:ankyrin repeat protein